MLLNDKEESSPALMKIMRNEWIQETTLSFVCVLKSAHEKNSSTWEVAFFRRIVPIFYKVYDMDKITASRYVYNSVLKTCLAVDTWNGGSFSPKEKKHPRVGVLPSNSVYNSHLTHCECRCCSSRSPGRARKSERGVCFPSVINVWSAIKCSHSVKFHLVARRYKLYLLR